MKLLAGRLGQDLKAVAVIMAGGSGTRFWPLSRSAFPKQFLPLAGQGQSLIQATADRLLPLVGDNGILVVTAGTQARLVQEQLPGAVVLAEPVPRNTAACVGFAALAVLEQVGDVPMICLPADHLVSGVQQVLEVYQNAVDLSRAHEVLVTIGIKPTTPETGYGYIKRGERCTEQFISSHQGGQHEAFKVQQFVEKPDLETASSYLRSGEFYWNSGMFIWRPSVILEAIKNYLPGLFNGLSKIRLLLQADADMESAQDVYEALDSVSIDTGVMEKAKNVRLLLGDNFSWSDVGSWSSWAETISDSRRDKSANFSEEGTLFVGANRCTLLSNCEQNSKRQFALVGVEDLIVVETEDAVLICRQEKSQEVKRIVELLKAKDRQDLL